MEDKFGFGKIKENIKKMQETLPTILANDAQNYFVKSFDTQSWNGQGWQEVQRRIPGTNAYKYPKKKDLGRHTRPILVGKGSTKLRPAVSNCIRVKTWPIVRCIVDLPYAARHNEGRDGMPKRQYMGIAPELDRQNKEKIKKAMGELWGF